MSADTQSSALSKPFLLPSEGMAHNVTEALESIDKMQDFDAQDNVFTITAHDSTLLDVVGFFPKATANRWKEYGWREKVLWQFLGDFGQAVQPQSERRLAGIST